MRTIKFERIIRTFFEVDLEILNEEQFKNELKDWCSKGQTLNFWDLENDHFASVKSIEIIELDNDDNDDNFLDELQEEFNINLE
jgi:hypothetical protein